MELEFVNQTNFTPNQLEISIASLVIFTLGFWISKKVFKQNYFASLAIAFIKSSFFFIYYSFFLVPRFFTLDSYNYLNTAVKATLNISSTFEFFYKFLSFQLMHFYGLGHYIYNAFITSLLVVFNSHSAIIPITANVIITFISSYYFYKTLKLIGLKTKYARWFFVFIVLHLELNVWSTFTMQKDILLNLFTIGLIYFTTLIAKKSFKAIHVIPMIYCVGGMLFSRFYIIPIFCFSIVIYYFLGSLIKRFSIKRFILILSIPFILLFLVSLIWEQFGDYLPYILKFEKNPIYGIIRFFLTPLPYSISNKYIYLIAPSIFNWIILPFTLYGIVACFSYKGIWRYMVLYYFILIIFYGIYAPHGMAPGSRHKLQIVSILILFQYVGILKLLFPKVKLLKESNAV